LLDSNPYCIKCHKCCIGTEMILLPSDIERIERHGYRGFYEFRDGFYRLRNVDGRCVFLRSGRCSIYEIRPLGCRVYPLIIVGEGVVEVDSFCPLSRRIPCEEIVEGVEELKRFVEELEFAYGYSVNRALFESSSKRLVETYCGSEKSDQRRSARSPVAGTASKSHHEDSALQPR